MMGRLVGRTVEVYAEMVNAPRGVLDSAEQQIMDEDIEKARAEMELVWLEANPVRERP